MDGSLFKSLFSQEEKAEKAAAKVTRTRETYEKDLEEMRTRRDAEISEVQQQLLHKEEQMAEQDKSSKATSEQHLVCSTFILLVCHFIFHIANKYCN